MLTKDVVLLLAVLLAILLTGLGYQVSGRWLDRKRFPAPGRLIEAGGTKLHLWEQGSGGPLVVLEAGIAGSCLGWAIVQPRIAEFTTVCSYDRAGLGWSHPGERPRTVEQITAELREMLAKAGYAGPYVLVGHSFGGLLMRAFAARYPELTGALVLVDPVSVSQWAGCSEIEQRRLHRAIVLSRRGAWLARFGVVRLALNLLVSGSRLIPKWIGRTAAGNGGVVMERLVGQVRRLPAELWPVVRAHWSDPKCFAAMANYLEALPTCARESEPKHPPAHIPQTVLSAATATEGERQEREQWVSSAATNNHVRVQETGHWIQLERPDVIVAAIRDAVVMMRSCSVI